MSKTVADQFPYTHFYPTQGTRIVQIDIRPTSGGRSAP